VSTSQPLAISQEDCGLQCSLAEAAEPAPLPDFGPASQAAQGGQEALTQFELALQKASKPKPRFYRLDYLWGKTDSKPALPQKRQQPLRQQEKEALAAVEKADEEVAAEVSLATAAVSASRPGRKKGQRDQFPRKQYQALIGTGGGKRTEPTAAARLLLAQELKTASEKAEGSLTAARANLKRKLNCSQSFARRLSKPEKAKHTTKKQSTDPPDNPLSRT
jgi:hypothetical protein